MSRFARLRLRRRLPLIAVVVGAVFAGPAVGSAFAWTMTKSVTDLSNPNATSPAGSFSSATPSALTASAGDTLEYKLTLGAPDVGAGPISNILVEDPLQGFTTFISCSMDPTTAAGVPNNGTCYLSGSTVVYQGLPPMSPPDSISIYFKVHVNGDAPAGTVVPNTGNWSSDQESGHSNQVNFTVGCTPPAPNTGNANANGNATGAIVTMPPALSALSMTLSHTSSTQHGLGVDSHSNNLLSLPLGVLTATLMPVTSTSSVTSSPAQSDNESTAETLNLNVLNGLIKADVVRSAAEATANGGAASVSSAGTQISGLQVNGTTYNTITPGERIAIPPGGLLGSLLGKVGVGSYLVVDEEASAIHTATPGQPTYAADLAVNAIHVHLDLTSLLGAQLGVIDIVIDQSVAHADFPQIPPCPGAHVQEVSGHAFVASEATNPTLVDVVSGFSGIPAAGGTSNATLTTFGIAPLLTGTGGTSASLGVFSPTDSFAASQAAIASKVCVLSTGSNCVVGADVIQSNSTSDANGSGAASNDAGTTFTNVTINGTPVLPINLQPNTTITLPGIGFVVLNEQTCDDGSKATHTCSGATHSGLTVRAIHVVVEQNALGISGLPGAEVIVSEAHSDATFQ